MATGRRTNYRWDDNSVPSSNSLEIDDDLNFQKSFQNAEDSHSSIDFTQVQSLVDDAIRNYDLLQNKKLKILNADLKRENDSILKTLDGTKASFLQMAKEIGHLTDELKQLKKDFENKDKLKVTEDAKIERLTEKVTKMKAKLEKLIENDLPVVKNAIKATDDKIALGEIKMELNEKLHNAKNPVEVIVPLPAQTPEPEVQNSGGSGSSIGSAIGGTVAGPIGGAVGSVVGSLIDLF